MKKFILVLTGLVIFHLLILSKLQFTAWPEMLSFPYMVNKGFLIYRDFHHVYQPLLTFILALFYKFAGFSANALELFTWVLVALIDLLLFFVSLQVFGRNWKALIPVFVFIMLQPVFEGNMLWFDLALIPFVLLSVLFLFRWSGQKRIVDIFFTGLFLSVGFLVKQQEALLFVPFLIYLFLKKTELKQFLIFSVGALLPVISLLIFLLINGSFNDYIFWTFKFPFYWLPKIPGYQVLPILKDWELLIIMIFIPVFAVFSDARKLKENRNLVFLFAIFILELVSAFPRFSFFHLQPALATFALICGYLFTNKNKIILLLAAGSLIFIGAYRWQLVFPEFNRGVRFYGNDEIHLAQRIDSITTPSDKIYLLGPNSASYVITNRVPPKPWIENYVWHFEIPGVQEKVIAGWESDPPKVIFWTPPQPGNWYDLGTYQPKKITDWIRENYIHKEDTKSGIEVWYEK